MMPESEILPAPVISTRPREPEDPKWQREHAAFQTMLSSLLATHRGQYVAIHEGQVVESGDDEVAVALQAYRVHGYVAIYVGLVSDEPQRVVRIPSPRSVRGPSG